MHLTKVQDLHPETSKYCWKELKKAKIKETTLPINASEGLTVLSGDTAKPKYRFDRILIEIIAALFFFFGCKNYETGSNIPMEIQGKLL